MYDEINTATAAREEAEDCAQEAENKLCEGIGNVVAHLAKASKLGIGIYLGNVVAHAAETLGEDLEWASSRDIERDTVHHLGADYPNDGIHDVHEEGMTRQELDDAYEAENAKGDAIAQDVAKRAAVSLTGAPDFYLGNLVAEAVDYITANESSAARNRLMADVRDRLSAIIGD